MNRKIAILLISLVLVVIGLIFFTTGYFLDGLNQISESLKKN